eukprot:1194944-Prorocentrum_minimum.AAC.3
MTPLQHPPKTTVEAETRFFLQATGPPVDGRGALLTVGPTHHCGFSPAAAKPRKTFKYVSWSPSPTANRSLISSSALCSPRTFTLLHPRPPINLKQAPKPRITPI